jgi:hypothetical protein
LPKNKDLGKARPIVPFSKHPMKKLFNIASRALTFLIKEAKLKAFTIWKVGDTTQFIKDLNSMIAGNGRAVHLFKRDIKEMYTALPHDVILNCVNILIDLMMKEKQRRNWTLTVRKFGREGVHWGKCYDPVKNVELEIEQLRDIVEFVVRNCVFSIERSKAWQRVGIPMGAALSPPLAILVCAIQEHLFTATLGVGERFIRGCRYVDDLLYATIFNPDDWKECMRCYQLQGEIENIYDRHLKLKAEDKGFTVQFLDRWVTFDGKRIKKIAFNKNWKSWKEKGEMAFRNIIPYGTYSSDSQVKGVVIGALCRIESSTTNREERLIVGGLKLLEFMQMMYPISMLEHCLARLGSRFRDSVWSDLKRFLRRVTISCFHPVFDTDM